MLRLDAVHPVVSGNKWYKLKHNLAAAAEHGKTALLSFGGGYSNHLVATAFAARQAGLQATGLVRGDYSSRLTPSLEACMSYGMQLVPLTGTEYAAWSKGAPAGLRERYPDAWIIPAGGANEAGVLGASELAAFIPESATDVCVSVGTGTTLAGLHRALPAHIRLHGFCAARSCAGALDLLGPWPERVSIHPVADPRFGKWSGALIGFMQAFRAGTGIALDIVYTGKMMDAVRQMLEQASFGPDADIICIHTGGLQGNPEGLFS